jgi:hypothetical protein
VAGSLVVHVIVALVLVKNETCVLLKLGGVISIVLNEPKE